MDVTVNIYGQVRNHMTRARRPVVSLRVPSGMAVRDVLDYLGIPAQEPLSIVVNGTHCGREFPLADGDVVSLFSMSAFADDA